MKDVIKLSIVALATTTGFATAAAAAELTVRVTGASGAQGEVGCTLHREGGSFPGGAGVAAQWVRANSAGSICRFSNLEPGAYAVSAFHDVNGDRRLSTNLVGIPSEPWGVSNDARPRFGAPAFAQARFEVGRSNMTVGVRLSE